MKIINKEIIEYEQYFFGRNKIFEKRSWWQEEITCI